MLTTNYKFYVFVNLFMDTHIILVIIVGLLLLKTIKENIEKFNRIEERIYENAA